MAPPHISSENSPAQLLRVNVSNFQQVVGPHSRGQQRLMRIAHSRIGPQQRLLFADPGTELLHAEFLEFVAGALGQRSRGVIGWNLCRNSPCGTPRVRMASRCVDDHVTDVLQELGGAIPSGRELEKFRRLVDEPGSTVASEKSRVTDEADQKRNVRLHTANAKLLQASLGPAGSFAEGAAPAGDFNQQRIVEWRDDGTGEGRASIESDAHPARRTIVRQPAVVRHELVRRIFRRHATLNRKTLCRDLILGRQADLRTVEPFALGNE